MFKFVTAESITTSSLRHPKMVATDHQIAGMERKGQIHFEAVIMGMSYIEYLKYIQDRYLAILTRQRNQEVHYEFDNAKQCNKLCVELNARLPQYLDSFRK